MKIEKTHYVIMKQGNININNETVFINDAEDGFTNDILLATKFKGSKTALYFKQNYDMTKNNGYESDLQIIPVKVTYEW